MWKFNNGNGALLCDNCRLVLKTNCIEVIPALMFCNDICLQEYLMTEDGNADENQSDDNDSVQWRAYSARRIFGSDENSD